MNFKSPLIAGSETGKPGSAFNRCSFGKLRLHWSAFLLVVAFAALNGVHAAETAYTDPSGIYLVKVPGAADPAHPVRTYLGIQLLPAMRFVGFVSQVSGKTLTLQDVENPTVYAEAGRESYVHVVSGNGRGFIANIDEFRSTDILCTEDLAQWIEPFDKIRIRPHSNISDLLGVNNKFGLGAGPDAATADLVVIWDPEAQAEKVYYFNSTRNRWEEEGVEADASLAVFRFPYGFYIVRRSPGTIRIALSGDMGNDAILLPVHSGANVFSLPVNLSASLDAIVRVEGDYSVINGPNAKLSDILAFEEPTTNVRRGPFYRVSRPSVSGWQEVGVNDSDASTEPLDFLSTLVLRRNGASGHVFVEGSLEPPAVPRPPLPPDPEAGEATLVGEMELPPYIPPGSVVGVEISTDLQTWETHAIVIPVPGSPTRVVFDLPAGQGRSFFRLAAYADF